MTHFRASGATSSFVRDKQPDQLIDTHCHVDAYPAARAILESAHSASIGVVAVTEDPTGYRRLRTRLGSRSGVVPALGLHPLRAGTAPSQNLARFLQLLPTASWIGEIGLDFSPTGTATRRAQLRVFEAILAEPHVARRPATVHSRGAEREVIDSLAQTEVRAVLHWYTGPLAYVDDALNAGLQFSVNPSMVRSAKGKALLRYLPREHVVLETDGPYCRVGNRPAAPADLVSTLQRLAESWETSVADADAIVKHNQRRLLGDALR